VVEKAIRIRIEKVLLSIIPIFSPTDAIINSTAPRLFMLTPTARDFSGFIFSNNAMPPAPISFPIMAIVRMAIRNSGVFLRASRLR